MECGQSHGLRGGERTCCGTDGVGAPGAAKRTCRARKNVESRGVGKGRAEYSESSLAGAREDLLTSLWKIAVGGRSAFERTPSEEWFPGRYDRGGVVDAVVRIGFLARQVERANGGCVIMRDQ